MKKIILAMALFQFYPLIFADYSAKIPLEQNDGGSLPNGSINFSVVPPPPYSSSAPNCNYSGHRTDGVPRYNGYIYHHIEYRGPGIKATVWFENQYKGEIFPELLGDIGYAMGAMIHRPDEQFFREFYEICTI